METSIELKKNGTRSLVAVLDGEKITEYLTCTDYDGTRPFGSQWVWGHYYGSDLERAVDDLAGRDDVAAIASYCYYQGTMNTTESNWILYASELSQVFGRPVSKETLHKVECELVTHPGILDVLVGDDYIDIVFGTAYCGLDLPETYAELEYEDMETAEAIEGSKWDDKNYLWYTER